MGCSVLGVPGKNIDIRIVNMAGGVDFLIFTFASRGESKFVNLVHFCGKE
jgi:hypothetical protein